MCLGNVTPSSSTVMQSSSATMSIKPSMLCGQWQNGKEFFNMSLQYPTYTNAQYEAMDKIQLNLLLKKHGLPGKRDVVKNRDAMGHFLWSQD
ncbi:hypothetical protein GW17_00051838 [Ensete ventricosum]|nr:hypothetical protein GW17_00051838 [Ensete ventricosum]RZS04636.1 hypothetical protein BHM03_00034996 [Ensete ventricosum]